MKQRGLKHVPVVDEQFHPLGVLYARDLLQVLLVEVEYEELLLRDYVRALAINSEGTATYETSARHG